MQRLWLGQSRKPFGFRPMWGYYLRPQAEARREAILEEEASMGEARLLSAVARGRQDVRATGTTRVDRGRTPTRHPAPRALRVFLALAIAAAVSLFGAASAIGQDPAAIRVLVFHGTPDATVNAGI